MPNEWMSINGIERDWTRGLIIFGIDLHVWVTSYQLGIETYIMSDLDLLRDLTHLSREYCCYNWEVITDRGAKVTLVVLLGKVMPNDFVAFTFCVSVIGLERTEEPLSSCDPAAIAYSDDKTQYIAYRVMDRDVHTPTYVEGSLGSRATGIRQRDELLSPVHETVMHEICLPLRKMRRVVLLLDADPGTPEVLRVELGYVDLVPLGQQSMVACDLFVPEGQLWTTVMAQQSEIAELQVADCRIQTVILDLLKADHRRQNVSGGTKDSEETLKNQMIELRRLQGTC
ncbi:hypothetical protein Tco_0439588 [Tanacetum coccineum]